MKKIVFGILICLFIVSCGKNYKTYTEKQKQEMYDIAYKENQKGKTEKIEEISKLMEQLEIASKKGDDLALRELDEWKMTQLFYSPQESYENYKVNLENRTW